MLYKRLNLSEESNIQRLEKLYQQKDDFADDDEDEENGEILIGEEQGDESDGDADYTYQIYDDDEDYLDDEEGDGADGKFILIYIINQPLIFKDGPTM